MTLPRFVLSVLLLAGLSCSSMPSGPRYFEGPGAVELLVEIAASPGAGADLENVFLEEFYPAVSAQPGFRHSSLLRIPNRNDRYILTIAFESEDLRLRWVETDLHQEAWPQMTEHMSGGEPQDVSAFGIVTPQID